MKKKLFITSLLLSIFTISFAQNTNNWQLISETDGIQIYSQTAECHDEINGIHQEKIIFKFVNTTEQDFSISWKYELWHNGICITCDDSEEHINTIELKAGESIEGNCEIDENPELSIFSKWLINDYGNPLESFKIVNLSINPK